MTEILVNDVLENVMAYAPREFVPGLIIHQDPDEYRRHGGCETTAPIFDDHDTAVIGPHFFLNLIYGITGTLVLAPIYSEPGRDRIPLDQALFNPHAAKALPVGGHLHKKQFWHVPVEVAGLAARDDWSTPGSRCFFAVAKFDQIGLLMTAANMNRPFLRPVT